MIASLCFIISGLLFSLILFSRFPCAPAAVSENKPMKISVIIPARNEERNLALLLGDLRGQSTPAYEIICVDDCSTDRTAEIARRYGAKLISVTEKPAHWLGKSWACQKGAEAAEGELLLFLDADVRLGANAIKRLLQAHSAEGCTVSVQPFHQMKKAYEQFSMFFSLIQFAANGLGRPNRRYIGLFGPVILISQKDYQAVGGHERIRESVIDDIALGQAMKRANLPFRLFLGDKDISYRMYPDGIHSLFRGWLKNIASGVVTTPPLRLVMIFFWVTSCLSVFINLAASLFNTGFIWSLVYLAFYLVWTVELFRIAKKIGSFSTAAILLFPIPIVFFLAVCVLSAIRKLFGIKTDWKGRKV